MALVCDLLRHVVSLTRHQLDVIRRYWTADKETGNQQPALEALGQAVQALFPSGCFATQRDGRLRVSY